MNPVDREAERQAVVETLAEDAFESTSFEDLTRMAAQICGTPSAMISLIDGDEILFKARTGFGADHAPRAQSFCDAALKEDGAFVVADATRDRRFASHPSVLGDPNIRFYAAIPIEVDGWTVGMLCALGPVPQSLTEDKLDQLQFLAQQVMTTLEQRRRSRRAGG